MDVFDGIIANDQCLVYVTQRDPFSGIGGATHVATIIRTYDDNDVTWYEVQLLSQADGRMGVGDIITVSSDMIVSNRPITDITPHVFYHDSPDGLLHAVNFVLKSIKTKPLTSTSRSALGSGIYGLINKNMTGTLFEVPADNPFIVQDLAHSESITLASLNTNRYIELVLESLSNRPYILTQLVELLSDLDLARITTLWNIVLARGLYRAVITTDLLGQLIAEYIYDFLTESIYQELPINRIFLSLGYTELLTTLNNWDGGCVSFVITDPATIIEGGQARY